MADQAFEDNYVQALKASGKAPANFMAFRRPDGSVYYGTDEQNTGVIQSRIQNVTGTSDGTSAGATSGGVDDKGKSVQSAEDAAAAEERRRQGTPQGGDGAAATGFGGDDVGGYYDAEGNRSEGIAAANTPGGHLDFTGMSKSEVEAAMKGAKAPSFLSALGIPGLGLGVAAKFDQVNKAMKALGITKAEAEKMYDNAQKDITGDPAGTTSDPGKGPGGYADMSAAQATAANAAIAAGLNPDIAKAAVMADPGFFGGSSPDAAPSSDQDQDHSSRAGREAAGYSDLGLGPHGTYGNPASTPNPGDQSVPAGYKGGSVAVNTSENPPDTEGAPAGTQGGDSGDHGADVSGDADTSGMGGQDVATGGEIKGYAAGGALPGMAMPPEASTQPVAQDIIAPGGPTDDGGAMKTEAGAYVLNAAAVKALGMDKINQMVKEVTEKVGAPAKSGPPGLGGEEPKPPINISNGEVIFSRAAKEYFGTKLLGALNGKGVEADPATAQKAQDKHMAEGGPPPAGLPEQTGNAQPSATGTLAMPQNTGATRDASAIPPGPLG